MRHAGLRNKPRWAGGAEGVPAHGIVRFRAPLSDEGPTTTVGDHVAIDDPGFIGVGIDPRLDAVVA